MACSVPRAPVATGSPATQAVATETRTAAVTTHSYIVEAGSTGAAAAAVKSAGGEVTAELGIIDAVSATLSDAQRDAVARAPGVHQVSADATVRTQSQSASVGDNFD